MIIHSLAGWASAMMDALWTHWDSQGSGHRLHSPWDSHDFEYDVLSLLLMF